MIAALAIVGGAMALIAAILVPKWLAAQRALALWVPLGSTGMKWIPGGDPALGPLLEGDVHRAVWCIAKYGPFTAVEVADAVKGWHLQVKPAPTWIDGMGLSVAGETTIAASTVQIGSDLRSLAHELEHVCCYRLTGDAQNSHAGWAENGLERGEAAYLHGEGA